MDSRIKKALEKICLDSVKEISPNSDYYKRIVICSPDVATRRYLGNLFLNNPFISNRIGRKRIGVLDMEYFCFLKERSEGDYLIDLQKTLENEGLPKEIIEKNARAM